MKLVDVDKLLSDGYEYVDNVDKWGEVNIYKPLDEIPTVDAIVIPENVTNEEVLKTLFEERVYNALKDRMQHTSWWNAPYEKRS